MSLFKEPESVEGITFMLRGGPGTGKTRFALGAKRVAGRCAYIGSDRGAKFYHKDPEVGGFLQVESRDVDVIRAAILELAKTNAEGFGAAIVDTITDLWEAEVAKAMPNGSDIRKWKPLRDGHENLLRSLQALPVHVFLICEEKPIYEKKMNGGLVELVEVGSKEDSDKKDSYVSDVRLRFYIEGKKFKCEVLKDRTGTFGMGHIIENPRPEMWIKSAPSKSPPAHSHAGEAPASSPLLSAPPVSSGAPQSAAPGSMDDVIRKEVDRLKGLMQFNDPKHAENWRTKHRHEWEAFPAWATKELKAYYDAQVEACRSKKQAVMELSGELVKKMKGDAA